MTEYNEAVEKEISEILSLDEEVLNVRMIFIQQQLKDYSMNLRRKLDATTPTVDIIESLRAACIEAGIPMIDKHQLVDKLVKELNNPYGGKAEERLKWAKDAGLEKFVDNKDAKIAYYVGCTASYRQVEVAIATAKLFEAFERGSLIIKGFRFLIELSIRSSYSIYPRKSISSESNSAAAT